jgi:hypothetical protein
MGALSRGARPAWRNRTTVPLAAAAALVDTVDEGRGLLA